MKQIFDYLREQIGSLNVNDIDVLQDMAIEKVDEAEAKWKAECCEYKPRKAWKIGWCYKTGCGNERTNTVNSNVKFCEYCGKPIKISEVE